MEVAGEGDPAGASGGDEWVLHQEFFGRWLGFPLHMFVRGLLSFYGCQLHHLTPNAIQHIVNFITFCECFLQTPPTLSCSIVSYA